VSFVLSSSIKIVYIFCFKFSGAKYRLEKKKELPLARITALSALHCLK